MPKTEDQQPEPEPTAGQSPDGQAAAPDTTEGTGQAPAKPPEKSFTQSEVNALMAKERKSSDAKYRELKAEFDALKKSTDDEKEAANERAKEQVEKLRQGLPDHLLSLLDKLTPVEQLEWLNDPEHAQELRKTIPPLPAERQERSIVGRRETII